METLKKRIEQLLDTLNEQRKRIKISLTGFSF